MSEQGANVDIVTAHGSADSKAIFQAITTRDRESSESQSLQEQLVGISSYASTGESGLSCIFKQRYTDFQVNEILTNGKVLHLTDIATSPTKKQKRDKDEDVKLDSSASVSEHAGQKRSLAEEKDGSSKRPKLEAGSNEASTTPQDTIPAEKIDIEMAEEDRATLISLFGEEVTAEVIKLYNTVLTYPNRKPRDHATVKTEIIESKATRTQAHAVIRTICNSKLETTTLQEEPGRMTIRAAAARSEQAQGGRGGTNNRDGSRQKGRVMWDELGGEYLHFTLYKENKDTMEALYFIASELKLKIATFSFAGTKDRRGVTVQRVAAHRVQKERLMHVTRLARGWKIGGFEYKKHGLELGQLQGNEFVITLRNCRMPGTDELQPQERLERISKTANQAAHDLGANGYINFYGLQRFGSFATGTHTVGMKILQNDLEGAVNSILAYDTAVLPANLDDEARSKLPKDDVDRAEAIRIWNETKNANEARRLLPRRFQAEGNIIQFLGSKSAGHRQDKDWQGALMCIQRGLRLMYVHAYQSLVWNRAAARRRELYGNKVVEGDLVVVGAKDEMHSELADKIDQDGEAVVHPDQEGSVKDDFVRARPLSIEEAESGKWDIFDIVLPLPGWDVLYPSNELGEFYEDYMGSDEGGHLDPHDMRRAWKDASLSGGYRKLMSRPLHGKVEVQAHLYAGESQLVETDVDRLNKTVMEAASNGQSHDQTGDQVAIVLRMQLGSSQYATMALRELTTGGAIAYKPEFSTDRQRR